MDEKAAMPADVSVIIAAHNVDSYIIRAVESALGQQGAAVEVIVVDDVSTDKTWEIISGITDPRVKCLRLPSNAGPSAARNAGIGLASGAWIAVLDGDDAFLPGRLARLLKRAAAMQADIVVDNLDVRREADGAAYPMFPPQEFAAFGMLDLARFIAGNQNFLGGSSLGYLKPVFAADFLRRHKLAYDPDIRIGEDYMLLAEALACGAVCAVEPEAGYAYTVRAGSISHRLSSDDVLRISKGDAKFLARHKLSPVAAQAQRRRAFNLKEAYAFTELVEALKKRDIVAAVKAACACPTAVKHLWRPVWVRVERLLPMREMRNDIS